MGEAADTAAGARLAAKIEALADWVAATPGAAQGGRLMATDDPERLGWDRIEAHLREDGLFAFRHIPVTACAAIESRLAALGFGAHVWRAFHGTAAGIPARRRPAARPVGYRIAAERRPSAATVAAAASFLDAHGIRPFVPVLLRGRAGPSILVTARNADGRLRALAYGHFPFNAHSPWHRTAWCGLVAVDAAARGSGLGRAVNDAAVDAMLHGLGADGIVEYAAEDNEASCRMIEGSGLVLREDIVNLIASPAGAARFSI
jgi:hypothetical protein